MRRTIDDGREENLAGSSPSAVGSDRRLDAVIPFPRRADTSAALVGSAAGGDPPSPPANFESLGSATQAVVMRLANKRIRIRVAGPGARENDLDQL
ncbi:hypothetical protein ELI23_08740 [Rhizobium leguminosarum]|nr:hypothetical protein ELI22_08710 [Rhizobium leguminosarum]TAV93867.1 hypothetical protein ELI21_08700 [Rhizobium leguminosarum]TAW34944.1 hypothetical protein ELI23_08740 [Rhizobium leguminosarum]